MLLSVVVPAYNAEKWIDECIGSIVRSVGDASDSVELIVVDDGSTDKTLSLLQKAADEYEWIRVIPKKNGGVGSARNAALSKVRGDYIAWIDSDDWVSEDWFPKIKSAIDEGADVIHYDTVKVEGDNKIFCCYGREGGVIDKDMYIRDLARDIRIQGGLCDKVVRREYYKDVVFNEKDAILEDYLVIIDITARAHKVIYLPEYLYNYRQQEGSLLHTVPPELSYRCVDIAKLRRDRVEDKYKDAALIGVLIQILMFCRGSAFDSRYKAFRREIRDCERYVRRNYGTVLKDDDISRRMKIKFLMLGLGILPIAAGIKRKVHG